MIGGQMPGIVFGLGAGIGHQHVPGAGGFAALLGCDVRREEIFLVGELAALAPGAGLFRLQHEAAALVEINEVAALVAFHIEFELVVTLLGLFEAQGLAEFQQKRLRLRPLPARGAAPIADEILDRSCRSESDVMAFFNSTESFYLG